MHLILHSCAFCGRSVDRERAFIQSGEIVIQCLACGTDNLIQADVRCTHQSCTRRAEQLYVQWFLTVDYVPLCFEHRSEKPWLSKATLRPTQSERRNWAASRAALGLMASATIAYYAAGPTLNFVNRTVLKLTSVPTYMGLNVLFTSSWLVLTVVLFGLVWKGPPRVPSFRRKSVWHELQDSHRKQGALRATRGADALKAAKPVGEPAIKPTASVENERRKRELLDKGPSDPLEGEVFAWLSTRVGKMARATFEHKERHHTNRREEGRGILPSPEVCGDTIIWSIGRVRFDLKVSPGGTVNVEGDKLTITRGYSVIRDDKEDVIGMGMTAEQSDVVFRDIFVFQMSDDP